MVQSELTGSPSDAAAVFDADAERYEAAYDEPGPGGQSLRARLAAVVRLVGEGPGEALDIGMGPGRLCATLAERGWNVSGIDPSPRMLEYAQRRLSERAADLRIGVAEKLPFPDASFDVVVATGTLEFVDDLDRGVAEIVRVVREDGLAVLSFPHYFMPYALLRRLVFYPAIRVAKRLRPTRRPAPARHRWPLSRRRFEALLARHGLETRSAEYVGVLLPGSLPRLLEGRGRVTGRLLASQIVFSAKRRPA